MSEDCREFVRGEEPFFLYWCSHDPHRAGVVEEHLLRPNDFGNPDEPFPGDEEQTDSEQDVSVPSFLPDTPEVRAELAQYCQSVSRLDRGVGRLVEVLRGEGKYENTVIIYVSDNGAAFPESKTTLYEPGMRLPCIVRNPPNEKREVHNLAESTEHRELVALFVEKIKSYQAETGDPWLHKWEYE